jgi:hypothetical protein
VAKVIGCIDKVEIWDPDRFIRHLADASLGTLAELEEEIEYGPALRVPADDGEALESGDDVGGLA